MHAPREQRRRLLSRSRNTQGADQHAQIAELFGQLDPGIAYSAFARLQSHSKDLALPANYIALTQQLDAQLATLQSRREAHASPSNQRKQEYMNTQLQNARTTLPAALRNYVQHRIDAMNPFAGRLATAHIEAIDTLTPFRDAINDAKSRLPMAERMALPCEQIIAAVDQAIDALARDVIAGVRHPTTLSKGR